MNLPEWNFENYYKGPDDPLIITRMNEATEKSEKFGRHRGKIANYSATQIYELIQEIEEIYDIVSPIAMFSHLLVAKDSQNINYQQFSSMINEKITKLQNNLVFVDIELNNLDDKRFEELVNDSILENYRHYLKDLRKFKPYQLSEEEEQMILLKNQYGRDAFRKLYGELTSSWEFELEVDGKIEKLNGAQLRSMRMNADKNIREKAMNLFFNRYRENKIVIVNIFNSLFKDYYIENSKRGYPTPITRRNLSNEIDDEIVKVLEETTTASYPNIVHRYYKLKKKILNMDELKLSDIYAPLPNVDKKYSWDEAINIVLNAFGEFDSEFRSIVERMIEENRIDAPPAPGKRGGAFCAGASPKEWPWVFLNFTGNINDISTLSHELGHAIHSVLGMVQTPINFDISLVTAEVASVFSEMIFTDYMLNKMEMSKEEKIAFISGTIERNIATSHRQNMFHRFELMAHELIKEKLISAEEYCSIYKSELEKMFGDSVKITDEYTWEWSTIPHFLHVYHYVYAYNASNLLVLALYSLYLERGKEFIPQFKKLLSVRKSKTPEEMFNDIGINIRDPKFWNKGLNYLEGMIDQLEELLE